MAKTKNEQKCESSCNLKDIMMKPDDSVDNFKSCTDDKCPLLLYGMGIVLVFLAVIIATGNILNSIIIAVVLTILAMVYAFFAKVPFKILSGNKDKALGHSLVAVGLCYTQFMIGATIFAILVKVGMLLNVPILTAILAIVGLLAVVYYILVALSVSTKAYKELFDTDYIVVLLANGITTAAMLIVIYTLYLVVMMSYVMYSMLGSGMMQGTVY